MNKPIEHRYSHIGEELDNPYFEALWDKSEFSLLRYKQILFVIKQSLANPRISSLEKRHNTIHSYLIPLLTSSFVSILSRSSITPHFSKLIRSSLFNIKLLYPSTSYLKRLLEDRVCTWGGSFGTLAYFLHLLDIKREYLTPSQLTSLVVRSCASFSNFSPSFPLVSLVDYQADEVIYQYHIDILQQGEIRDCISLLSKLSSILPSIVDWYLNSYLVRGLPSPPLAPSSHNDLEAYITLSSIGKLMVSRGLSGREGISNYDLIHQSLAPIWTSVIEEIISIRNNCLFDINYRDNSLLNSLCYQLLQAIPRSSSGLLSRVNYLILSSLYPPGGYNLALVMVAITLINRALILTYPPSSPSNEDIDKAFTSLYKAGVCLRKSNLSHFMMIGNNLCQLSSLSDSLPIDIKDLYYVHP